MTWALFHSLMRQHLKEGPSPSLTDFPWALFRETTVHVVEPPKIITLELKAVIQGESAKFTIQASGTEPLNYHWQWKPAEGGNRSEKWQRCPAKWSDGATLTVPKVEESKEGSYRCVVSNDAGEQTSNPAELTIGT